LKEEKVACSQGENQAISNIILDDGDMTLSSMEPTYTAKADVYSFAMTCYEILTGNVPFDGFPRCAIHGKVMEGVRPKLPRHIDMRLSNLIQMCWDIDPQKRPTFLEICSRLQDIGTSIGHYECLTNMFNSSLHKHCTHSSSF
jgi:serine/threonine protein kinase